MECPRIDDEHNLIARYAAKLAIHERKNLSEKLQLNNNSTENPLVSSTESFNMSFEHKVHQDLIDELEASNRQIMEEIKQLRQAKDATYSSSDLLFELQMLKQHKGELECRMSKLQDGRKDLMEQLERLMTLLKSRDQRLTSPLHKRSSSLPRASHQPPLQRTLSNGSRTPQLTPQHSLSSSSSPLNTVSRTKRQFSELFTAADAINDALSQLVGSVTTDDEVEHEWSPSPLPRMYAGY